MGKNRGVVLQFQEARYICQLNYFLLYFYRYYNKLHKSHNNSIMTAPLAERLRPKKLDDYIGQEHILGKNKPLRKAIEANLVPSMILWGPPGTGKTTLALLIAETTKRQFHQLNAVSSGVKELREVISRPSGLFPPIVFIDEIHRYNKSQQDSLLAAVEKG